MLYTVTVGGTEGVQLSPENQTEEILQNIRTILATPRGTAPLDRGFGIPVEFLGRPMDAARALIVAALTEAIGEYEPRAELQSVEFQEDVGTGKLVPVVEVKISE